MKKESKYFICLTLATFFFITMFPSFSYCNTSNVDVKRIAGSGRGYVDGPVDEAKFDMPSRVLWGKDDETVYVLDGVCLRRIEDGKVETVARMWDISEQLEPYGLDNEARINSFRYGNMVWGGDKIYLSGVMLDKDVKALPHLTPKSYKWTREGFTYNVFFEIDPYEGTMELLRADKAYCNIVPRQGNYVQGIWDSRPDLIQHKGKTLYAYYFFTPIPKIQPMGDGFLVMKSEDPGTTSNNTKHYLAKWYKDGSEEKLFNLSELENRYYDWNPVPNNKHSVPKDGMVSAVAFPLDDNIVYLTDGVNAVELDIKTGETTDVMHWLYKFMDGEAKQMKGSLINGDIHFLDDKGIWKLKEDGRAYRIVKAKHLNYSGRILGYDINDDNEVVVGNYQRGTIDKFSISDMDKYLKPMIYLNGRAVMPAQENKYYPYVYKDEPYHGEEYTILELHLVEELLNVDVEIKHDDWETPEDEERIVLHHPSGRKAQIKPLYNDSTDLPLSWIIEAYNEISVVKLEGKYDGRNLYLRTKGTVDSKENNNASGVHYGLPAVD